ncbi:ROK family protein [Enterococcus lemanii]|uniref:ROK family protein n=1 Tax=Enterococcus lemanii TaxID=1159752 RepID=A0ABV9MXF9_9ENTE|nr:ROK family protein [Enterococcus lemanii]MBM7710221.1 putative NBD/HSP70 family sugar kinase [Enterococcus lemanii]
MKKYLAIDIGGSFVKISQIDHSGNIYNHKKVKTPTSLLAMTQLIEELVEELNTEIKGVGISCPGRVDIQTGTVYNGGALPYLHEFSFKKLVEEKYDIPCAVCNDGKAAALSEMWLGNLKGIPNGAAIVLGTGVGGGLVGNGEILQGSHFQAGELSFMPRQAQGAQTEELIGFTASAVAFVQKAALLLKLTDLDDGKKVFAEILTGKNEALQALFSTYCREIGHIILNLQAILDIEKVVIGGGISAQPILIEEIKKQYQFLRSQSEMLASSFAPITIEKCRFGNEANLLGAIYQLLLNLEKNKRHE